VWGGPPEPPANPQRRALQRRIPRWHGTEGVRRWSRAWGQGARRGTLFCCEASSGYRRGGAAAAPPRPVKHPPSATGADGPIDPGCCSSPGHKAVASSPVF